MNKSILFILATFCGALISYVDSRPNWDDTGVTVFTILLCSGAFAFGSPRRWWLWAIAIGIWIPLLEIARTQNFGSLLALVVALVGAVSGSLLRKMMFGNPLATKR
jgi:hypothetical protein